MYGVKGIRCGACFRQMAAALLLMSAPRDEETEDMLTDMPLATEADGLLLEALEQILTRAREILGWGQENYKTRSDAHKALYGTPEVLREIDIRLM